MFSDLSLDSMGYDYSKVDEATSHGLHIETVAFKWKKDCEFYKKYTNVAWRLLRKNSSIVQTVLLMLQKANNISIVQLFHFVTTPNCIKTDLG